MKRHGHLYEKVWDWDNLWVAYQMARRGKTKYRQVREFDPVAEIGLRQLQQTLQDESFRNGTYRIFRMTERGKERTIYALPFFPDRILHHAIVQVLAPIWVPSLIRDTYASIPGRGIHDAVGRVEGAVAGRPDLYVLKCDIRQFYPSVRHHVVKRVLRRQLKDPQLLSLLDEIIDSAPGIPIGNYLSQYFGNLVLSPLDHHIKQQLRIEHYFRYCDDLVLLHPSRRYLHECRRRIAEFLVDYELELKGNWQVFPLATRGLDFVGYRFWPTHTTVRARNVQRLRWRLQVRRMALNEAVRTLHCTGSFKGWLRYAQTKNLTRRLVLPARARAEAYLRRLSRKLLIEATHG
jgi:hypothetical protein